MQVGESFIIFTEFTDLAGGCVFLSSNREGDLTDARNRLHHSRGRTKTVYAPRLSLNCLTVAALHLANLEQQFQRCPSDASTIGLNWKYSLISLKKCCFRSGPSLTRKKNKYKHSVFRKILEHIKRQRHSQYSHCTNCCFSP